MQFDGISNHSYLASVAGVSRYEILYNFGGLYTDFKNEGLKPLNNFLKY